MEQGKVAADEKGAWEIQERYEGKPHAWIQWKGTDVCMDVHCFCGASFHIDGDFCYYVRCPDCNRVLFCNGHIEMIEVTNSTNLTPVETGEVWYAPEDER